MCGIFGWHLSKRHNLSLAQREAMAASLVVGNTTRGRMSWGTYAMERRMDGSLGAPEVERRVGRMDAVKGIGTIGLADVLMGHTRYATRGAITVANSHPFKVGDVTLSHNGMIYNCDSLDRAYNRTCPVDSMHIAHHLHEGLPFTDMEGYGAIQYTRDAKPGEVHLCRMSGGQLAVHGLGSQGNCWGTVWSSDKDHLVAALDGAGIKHFAYETPRTGRVYVASDDGTLYLLPEETLRHDLADGRQSEREREYSQWLTTGAQGPRPSPGRSLTKREKRAEAKRRKAAGKRGDAQRALMPNAAGRPLTALDTPRIVKPPAPIEPDLTATGDDDDAGDAEEQAYLDGMLARLTSEDTSH